MREDRKIMDLFSKYIPVLVLFLSGCGIRPGSIGVSSDMAESKTRGVFVQEYRPIINPVKVNDSIYFQVNEVWVEKSWQYGKNNDNTSILNGYQVCIHSTEKSLKNYAEVWTIENSFTESLRFTSKSNLMGDIGKLPDGDTISYKIVKGYPLMSDSLIVIGNLVLIKK